MEKKTPAGRRMKIVKVSIVDQVCDAVKKDIMNGTWKAGEKIPSESELAEQFGVNRLSVRMALHRDARWRGVVCPGFFAGPLFVGNFLYLFLRREVSGGPPIA